MLIRNAYVYGPDHSFVYGAVRTAGGRITETGQDVPEPLPGEKVLDAQGSYVIPGLIDMHFHGCRDADFCDGTQEALETIASYELKCGVTAICPATLTLPADELCRVLAVGAEFQKRQERGELSAPSADLIGVNMEGPFISPVKKGAQNGAYILPADRRVCESFLDSSEGLVKYVGLAPEEAPDFEDYIAALKDRVHISLAHTNADYETAMAAFSAGASHAVHLFNGMSGFSHREPGTVGAVFDQPNVTAELICDGNHVHPAAARTVFRLLGDERVILISDSLRSAGMGDGEMLLGGQKVLVKGTKAVLAEGGNLAGSVTDLSGCLRIAVTEMGIPLESAVRAAAENPAKALDVFPEYGCIAPGSRADLVFLDRNIRVTTVIKDGAIV